MEWIKEKEAFNLYFSSNENDYKVYVDDVYVGFFVKKKISKLENWDSLGHFHYDNESDSFRDLYEDIILWIREHNK